MAFVAGKTWRCKFEMSAECWEIETDHNIQRHVR